MADAYRPKDSYNGLTNRCTKSWHKADTHTTMAAFPAMRQTARSGVIQVQRDRFLHNWRKIQPTDAYPRYRRVMEMYSAHCSTLQKFLNEKKLGTIVPLQYELTYINHIMQGEGWHSL